MRLAVLICGITAGIVGLGFAWWGNPSGLLNIVSLPTPLYALAVLLIHIASGLSVAGGLISLAAPRMAGVVMLVSAMLWLILVALMGTGVTVSMGVIILIAGGGGLLAFLPSLNRSLYRLQKTDEIDALPPIGSGTMFEAQRVTLDRSEDHSKPFAPEPVEVRETTPPFQYFGQEIPTRRAAQAPRPTGLFSDVHDIVEPIVEPEPAPVEPPPEPVRQPVYGEGRPFTVSDPVADFPTTPVEAKAAFPWWDAEEQQPRRGIGAALFRPGRADEAPRATRPGTVYQVRPADNRSRPRGRRKQPRTHAALGIAAIGIVLVGTPVLLVVDNQITSARNAESIAAAAPAQPTVIAELPQAPAVVVETPVVASPAPATDRARLPSSGLLALPAVAATAVQPLTATAQYAGPIEYCESLREVDDPDAGLMASGLPADLITGIREAVKLPEAEVVWRCMQSTVWVCAQPVGGVECDQVPTTAEMEQVCADNPGLTAVRSAGGIWSCNGLTPVPASGSQQSTDARGFDRRAWLALTRTAPDDAAG